MRLTLHTDYAMRVLLHVGTRDDRLSSIAEIAEAYGVSRNHMMKVVQKLARAGFIATQRGRNGGLQLARPATAIGLGDVVRHAEDGFDLVDCSTCLVAPACTLPGILNEATMAFLTVLDKYTLADLLTKRTDLRSLFGGG